MAEISLPILLMAVIALTWVRISSAFPSVPLRPPRSKKASAVSPSSFREPDWLITPHIGYKRGGDISIFSHPDGLLYFLWRPRISIRLRSCWHCWAVTNKQYHIFVLQPAYLNHLAM